MAVSTSTISSGICRAVGLSKFNDELSPPASDYYTNVVYCVRAHGILKSKDSPSLSAVSNKAVKSRRLPWEQ